eukprot:gnl/MRDRNA2_/MRDRNA2_91404_c0_seq1.p1 gnl/MRDRNA2_/MRDRNA2_91404_c0~~gnl/MRDRNA2_/MRDRNA2_91404_c0_seq1.p1  ORF type:complete len:381 (-),score=71.91 gnl/MRDRNA2_/MRDRNA2_91404_c0_seq1:97-1239(-)
MFELSRVWAWRVREPPPQRRILELCFNLAQRTCGVWFGGRCINAKLQQLQLVLHQGGTLAEIIDGEAWLAFNAVDLDEEKVDELIWLCEQINIPAEVLRPLPDRLEAAPVPSATQKDPVAAGQSCHNERVAALDIWDPQIATAAETGSVSRARPPMPDARSIAAGSLDRVAPQEAAQDVPSEASAVRERTPSPAVGHSRTPSLASGAATDLDVEPCSDFLRWPWARTEAGGTNIMHDAKIESEVEKPDVAVTTPAPVQSPVVSPALSSPPPRAGSAGGTRSSRPQSTERGRGVAAEVHGSKTTGVQANARPNARRNADGGYAAAEPGPRARRRSPEARGAAGGNMVKSKAATDKPTRGQGRPLSGAPPTPRPRGGARRGA